MAEEKKDKVQDFEEGPAAQAMVSLSQALLAPLDSIFKAQIHAARSFLNLLLQLGYGHRPVNREGMAIPPRRRARLTSSTFITTSLSASRRAGKRSASPRWRSSP